MKRFGLARPTAITLAVLALGPACPALPIAFAVGPGDCGHCGTAPNPDASSGSPSAQQSGTASAPKSGGGGAASAPPATFTPPFTKVSANSVVKHGPPPPPAAAQITPPPPQAPVQPTTGSAPIGQVAAPEAPPAPPPVAVQPVVPQPIPVYRQPDPAPVSIQREVSLTSGQATSTSAEIIILVLLAVGAWYFGHRVIVQLTSRNLRHA